METRRLEPTCAEVAAPPRRHEHRAAGAQGRQGLLLPGVLAKLPIKVLGVGLEVLAV